jgi:carboxypeptidase C (cathepsin A)
MFANVLYLESPSGVGFSYGTINNYTSTDASTALNNYNFLQGFFTEYTEFQKNRFYVAGER